MRHKLLFASQVFPRVASRPPRLLQELEVCACVKVAVYHGDGCYYACVILCHLN